MTQEQFLKLFPRSKIIGKAFPVFKLDGREFALARIEKKVDKGHKGDVLRKSQVLQVHFKPVYDLIGALQPEKYHPEGDAYNHTMLCLDNSVLFTQELEVHYSILVHDFGKGTTPKEEYPHHYGHEARGVDIVKKFSKDIGVPKAWEKGGITSCLEHMRGGIFYKMKPSKKVDFIERVDKSYLGLHGLQIVVNCDKMRNNLIQDERYQFEKVGIMCLEQVNANKVSKKYGIKEGIALGNKIHEERINWIKDFFIQ